MHKKITRQLALLIKQGKQSQHSCNKFLLNYLLAVIITTPEDTRIAGEAEKLACLTNTI